MSMGGKAAIKMSTRISEQTLFFPVIDSRSKGGSDPGPSSFSKSLMKLRLPEDVTVEQSESKRKVTKLYLPSDCSRLRTETRANLKTTSQLIKDYLPLEDCHETHRGSHLGSSLKAVHCPSGERVSLQSHDLTDISAYKYAMKYCRFSHRHLVRFFDIIEQVDKSTWLVTDNLTTKALNEFCLTGHSFNLRDIREVIRQVLTAVEYLQRHSYVHKSLNIKHIRLHKIVSNTVSIAITGLEDCERLPDTKNSPLDKGANIADIGYILLSLLTGQFITRDTSEELTQQCFDDIGSKDFNKDCVHLLERLFTKKKGATRISLPELINHPWLNKGANVSLEGYMQQCRDAQRTVNGTIVRHIAHLTGHQQAAVISKVLAQRPDPLYVLYTMLLRCWRRGGTLPISLDVSQDRIKELMLLERRDFCYDNDKVEKSNFRLPKLREDQIKTCTVNSDGGPRFRYLLQLLTRRNRQIRSRKQPPFTEESSTPPLNRTNAFPLSIALSRDMISDPHTDDKMEHLSSKEKLRLYQAKKEMTRLCKTPPSLMVPPNSAHFSQARVHIVISDPPGDDEADGLIPHVSLTPPTSCGDPDGQPDDFAEEEALAETLPENSYGNIGDSLNDAKEAKHRSCSFDEGNILRDGQKEELIDEPSDPDKSPQVTERYPAAAILNPVDIRCADMATKSGGNLKGRRHTRPVRQKHMLTVKLRDQFDLSFDASKIVAKWKHGS